MMRRTILLAIALLAAVNLAAADTYPRQPIGAIHYVFHLELRDDTDEIAGETAATLELLEQGVTEVSFDLASAAGGKGMTVSEVSAGGRPLRFAHENSRLRISLPSPSRALESVTVVVKYRGVPVSGLRIGANKFGERCFFGESWPDKARQWLPTIDHISYKATGEFVVTAPAHYQVVSNGVLVEEMDLPGDLRRTHWRQPEPIAPWLYTIGVGRFAVHHADAVMGTPLETWVFSRDRDAGRKAFELPARQAIEFFSDLVGPYPYRKLANVEASGFGGGMEHATAIAYGEAAIDGRPIQTLVAHEIAHAWFGDGVTERDWDEVWLSEGFATFLTNLFVEHVNGHDAFTAALARDRDRVIAAEKKSPDTPIIHRNLSNLDKVLNTFVYQKGGWVLHMLRERIGAESFRTGLRTYYQRYLNRTATTDGFRQVMEAASGQDLSAFFRQWLNRPGVPAVAATWHYDAARNALDIEVSQTQQDDPFELPLEFGIRIDETQPLRVEKMALTDRRQRTTITLDPNVRALVDGSIVRR